MKIRERIYRQYYDGWQKICIKDLPPDLQPTDEIEIEKVESFYSENESWDAHTIVQIYREREETEEEKEKRLVESAIQTLKLKAKRYETYLLLKKEFENDSNL